MFAFVNGDICLYDDENDTSPIRYKINLKKVTKAEWNVNGDCFAACGFINEGDIKGCISLYNTKMELIKIVKINEPIVCFSFNARGTQIALETQNTIYFGIIKQNYKWCYFGETLVYAYLSDQEHHTVTFWNTKNNIFHIIFGHLISHGHIAISRGNRCSNLVCVVREFPSVSLDYLQSLSSSLGFFPAMSGRSVRSRRSAVLLTCLCSRSCGCSIFSDVRIPVSR